MPADSVCIFRMGTIRASFYKWIKYIELKYSAEAVHVRTALRRFIFKNVNVEYSAVGNGLLRGTNVRIDVMCGHHNTFHKGLQGVLEKMRKVL